MCQIPRPLGVLPKHVGCGVEALKRAFDVLSPRALPHPELKSALPFFVYEIIGHTPFLSIHNVHVLVRVVRVSSPYLYSIFVYSVLHFDIFSCLHYLRVSVCLFPVMWRVRSYSHLPRLHRIL